jgi:uncharacterized membrane protein
MSSIALPPLPAGLEYCVVARRNDSLRQRERWQVFGALALVSLALALAFAAVGAWPVLPYSVLELALLGCAFRWIERRARDWERLAVAGDRVIVEREAGGARERREFNRYWLRVDVEAAAPGGQPQLRLSGGGMSWVFGSALPVNERIVVARELRRMTGMRR